MEQVLAEPPGRDLLAQVAGGGRDHSHVHLHVAVAAHAAEAADRPGPAGCVPGSRAACRPPRRGTGCRRGRVRRPRSCAVLPSSPSSPNNSTSMRSGVMPAALIGDELALARAARRGVDQACDHLLARARWAGDHHPAVGRRDLGDQLAQLLGGHRLAGHAVRRDRLGAQAPVLAASATPASSARSTISTRRSDLKGFSRNS